MIIINGNMEMVIGVIERIYKKEHHTTEVIWGDDKS